MKSDPKDLIKKTATPKYNNTSLIKKIIYLLLILIITYTIYSPVKNARFTNWDDLEYITKNNDITSFKKYNSNLLIKPYLGNYHPLTMLSYTYDYSVGKLNPKVYHKTNILLHVFNAILVFWLIILLTGNLEVGFLCGVLFGIHPLHVESVAWVSERKNVLYTLFFLLSLIAYIKYIKIQEGKIKFYFLALFLFLLSLLSKGMAVSLSITLIAIDYLFDRKLLSKKVILEKVPFLTLSLVFGLIAFHLQPINAEKLDYFRSAPLKNPFHEKILYAIYNISQYTIKLFAPMKLAAFYPYPEKNVILPLQYYIMPFLTVVLLITSFIILIKNKTPYSKRILFSFLFFIVNIALVLQLLPVGNAIMADRYAYIPSIGFFLLIGFTYTYIIENKTNIQNTFIVILTGYCVWFSYLTYERCKVWHDSISLWTDEIEKYPNLSFAYNNRGNAKYRLRDLNGALEDYKKSIELDSSSYQTYNNIGIIETIKGNQQKALNYFDKTLSLNKNNVETYKSRAMTKYILKDYKGSVKDYSTYLKFNSLDHEIFFKRGLTEYKLKNYSNAINDYTKSINLAPTYAEAYCNRGTAKYAINDQHGAIIDFNKAIEINPTYNLAYYNRGSLKFLLGLTEEACSDFQKAGKYGYKELKQNCK